MTENSIVRENLMTEPNYTGYCGDWHCSKGMPRTKWDKTLGQFKCSCGWISKYPADFIDRYRKKWNK